jgi:EAL domain-containing protein (putative c-di-GMP-specific phosphodiesterase class I)
MHSRGDVREEIIAALEAPEGVVPTFQPIVDLRTGLVAGYESLARFSVGTRRASEEWFTQAHSHGLGLRLEARAAKAGLAAARRPYGTFLALNLSPAGLASQDVQAVLPDRLDGIVVELTDHAASLDDHVFQAARRSVRERGGRLAIDATGTGYAGLRHLMWAAPDIFKLDRDLVHRVHADPAKASLVEALVRYGREIGVIVCAEGVEAIEDVERLADLDVTYAQGHVLGRPSPPWAGVDKAAAAVCRTSLAATLTGAVGNPADLNPAERIQWLMWRLSEATNFSELADVFPRMAYELGADEVLVSMVDGDDLVEIGAKGSDPDRPRYRIADYPATAKVLREQHALQIVAGDPGADEREINLLRELGHESMLMLPAACGGSSIGLIECYRNDRLPWSRFQIVRARMVSLQLAAALERIARTS